jgi:hypothetical protein
MTSTTQDLSLDASRQYARSISEICRAFPESALAIETLKTSLQHILHSIHTHFPENCFCDLDYLAQSLVDESTGSDVVLERLTRKIVQLLNNFGTHSPVGFRYTHDFLYGFDWAKWKRSNPGKETLGGPFSEAFLDHMLERGSEIVALISRNDATYPALPREQPRNPFQFSREPEDEIRLHRALTAMGQLPLNAWQCSAKPDASKDYREIRTRCAMGLGIRENPNKPARPL